MEPCIAQPYTFQAGFSRDRRVDAAQCPQLTLTVSFRHSSFGVLPSIDLVSGRASNCRVRA